METQFIKRPDHLSASSINSFLDNKSQWFVNRVLGKYQDAISASFARGLAVEEGLTAFFEGHDETVCIKTAIELYKEKTPDHKFLDQIEPMTREAIKWFSKEPYGPVRSAQDGFYIMLNNTKVIGYIDYRFDDVIVDMKCLARTPSALDAKYKNQGTIYSNAYPGKQVIFVFFVPLKTKVGVKPILLTPNDKLQASPIVSNAITRINRVFDIIEGNSKSALIELIKDMLMPSPSSFWSKEDADFFMEAFDFDEKSFLKAGETGTYKPKDGTKSFSEKEAKEKSNTKGINPFMRI